MKQPNRKFISSSQNSWRKYTPIFFPTPKLIFSLCHYAAARQINTFRAIIWSEWLSSMERGTECTSSATTSRTLLCFALKRKLSIGIWRLHLMNSFIEQENHWTFRRGFMKDIACNQKSVSRYMVTLWMLPIAEVYMNTREKRNPISTRMDLHQKMFSQKVSNLEKSLTTIGNSQITTIELVMNLKSMDTNHQATLNRIMEGLKQDSIRVSHNDQTAVSDKSKTITIDFNNPRIMSEFPIWASSISLPLSFQARTNRISWKCSSTR